MKLWEINVTRFQLNKFVPSITPCIQIELIRISFSTWICNCKNRFYFILTVFIWKDAQYSRWNLTLDILYRHDINMIFVNTSKKEKKQKNTIANISTILRTKKKCSASRPNPPFKVQMSLPFNFVSAREDNLGYFFLKLLFIQFFILCRDFIVS